jgi:hypothetical protein
MVSLTAGTLFIFITGCVFEPLGLPLVARCGSRSHSFSSPIPLLFASRHHYNSNFVSSFAGFGVLTSAEYIDLWTGFTFSHRTDWMMMDPLEHATPDTFRILRVWSWLMLGTNTVLTGSIITRIL